MDVSAVSIPLENQRRLRVSEYHRMIDAGVFHEDERLELLAGVLVRMSPHGSQHARVIQRLNHLLVRVVGDEHIVRPQLPLTLDDDSEPEPDLAVVARLEAETAEPHPRNAALVVEVAGESLAYDRGIKCARYATAGIPEYWIVNLAEGVIEVSCDPSPATGRYQTTRTCRPGETLQPRFAPGVVIAVSDIVG